MFITLCDPNGIEVIAHGSMVLYVAYGTHNSSPMYNKSLYAGNGHVYRKVFFFFFFEIGTTFEK